MHAAITTSAVATTVSTTLPPAICAPASQTTDTASADGVLGSGRLPVDQDHP